MLPIFTREEVRMARSLPFIQRLSYLDNLTEVYSNREMNKMLEGVSHYDYSLLKDPIVDIKKDGSINIID